VLACHVGYHYHQNKLIYFISFPCFDKETSAGSPRQAKQGADRDGINRIHKPDYRNTKKKRTDVLDVEELQSCQLGC